MIVSPISPSQEFRPVTFAPRSVINPGSASTFPIECSGAEKLFRNNAFSLAEFDDVVLSAKAVLVETMLKIARLVDRVIRESLCFMVAIIHIFKGCAVIDISGVMT